MSIAAFAAFCLIQSLYLDKFTLLTAGYHHLGYALTVIHHKILLRQINEHHANLTTIVRIDSTWRIQHRQPMLEGQSTARPHLSLIALRQRNMQTRRYQTTLQGMQGYRLIQIGTQVHAGTLNSGVCRQLLVPAVDYLNFNHCETFLSLQCAKVRNKLKIEN